jgi:hypothetical protein
MTEKQQRKLTLGTQAGENLTPEAADMCTISRALLISKRSVAQGLFSPVLCCRVTFQPLDAVAPPLPDGHLGWRMLSAFLPRPPITSAAAQPLGAKQSGFFVSALKYRFLIPKLAPRYLSEPHQACACPIQGGQGTPLERGRALGK